MYINIDREIDRILKIDRIEKKYILFTSLSLPFPTLFFLPVPVPLSYPILSLSLSLPYPTLSYPVLSYPILSYPILSLSLPLSYPVLSYPILIFILITNTPNGNPQMIGKILFKKKGFLR